MTPPVKKAPKRQPRGLIILHEDQDIIVVDKAPGLLSVGTDKEKVKTAYYRLTDYVRKGNSKSRERIFIVHRLDKDTSGIMVFARNFEAKKRLQDNWDAVQKTYLAVVRGTPKRRTAIISSHLSEDKNKAMRSVRDKQEGKLARTQYRVVHAGKTCALLEINLLTGRKNQIRVHLSELGHPIMGDKKYNEEDKGSRRLALHAVSIAFHHPKSGELMTFKAQVPPLFMQLVGKPILGESQTNSPAVEEEILLLKVGGETKQIGGEALKKLRAKEAAEAKTTDKAPLDRFPKNSGTAAPTPRKKHINRPFSKKQSRKKRVKP